MIELRNDNLVVCCPDVHEDATCEINFQRTLRIPDDNREYPLPVGLGNFPMFHVDDYAKGVPASWIDHGGVFLPMYQSEAMWISFGWSGVYPFAVKIAAGKINAVSGDTWTDGISDSPQDYVVLPEQPWLDGFSVQEGLIRQFVAMPLGEGYTAEGQITGEEIHGGLQLAIYPMKADYYEKYLRSHFGQRDTLSCMMAADVCDEAGEMGLAPGGLMQQEIYDDPYGLEAWETTAMSRCFVHITNSRVFHDITGLRSPTDPPSAKQYKSAGIPWFDYWNDELKALKGSKILSKLDSVATKKIKNGKKVKEPLIDIKEAEVVQLGKRKSTVRDGRF